jgi:hypothetical protein
VSDKCSRVPNGNGELHSENLRKEVAMEKIIFPLINLEPIGWGFESRKAEEFKAVVDVRTGKVFSCVSPEYRLVRHEDAIRQVEEALSGKHDLGPHEVTTEFYNDMGRMRRTYRFPETRVEVRPGDFVNPQLHLVNSYDLSAPFEILLGAFRFVCENGLVVGTKHLHLKRRHHVSILQDVDIRAEVSTALKRFEAQADTWKQWAERPLSPGAYAKVMEKIELGKGALETIEARMQHEARGRMDREGFPLLTVWVFFNVLTWWITHKAVSLNHRITMEHRLRRAMGLLRRVH